jgi:hypothetical protein
METYDVRCIYPSSNSIALATKSAFLPTIGIPCAIRNSLSSATVFFWIPLLATSGAHAALSNASAPTGLSSAPALAAFFFGVRFGAGAFSYSNAYGSFSFYPLFFLHPFPLTLRLRLLRSTSPQASLNSSIAACTSGREKPSLSGSVVSFVSSKSRSSSPSASAWTLA